MRLVGGLLVSRCWSDYPTSCCTISSVLRDSKNIVAGLRWILAFSSLNRRRYKVSLARLLSARLNVDATLGPWECSHLPSVRAAKALFPEVAGSALLPLTGWRSSSERYLLPQSSHSPLKHFVCARGRTYHCEYRSQLPNGLFPSTLTTSCHLSPVRLAANWRASFVTLRGRLVLPQSPPPSHALLGDSSMPPPTSPRATTTVLRAPP